MTVDPAMYLPFRLMPGTPDRDQRQEGDDTFSRLLAAMDPALAREAGHAAPLAPRIGSRARAFEEQALVLQIALAAPTSVAADQAAENPSGIEEIVEAAATRLDQALAVASRAGGAGATINGWNGSLAAMRAQLASWQPAPLPKHAPPLMLQSVPLATVTPASSATGSKASAPVAPSRATSATTCAAARTPFTALVLVQEDGLAVIIRAPQLGEDERSQLQNRIGDLFARRGLPAPVLRIAGQPAGASEGNA